MPSDSQLAANRANAQHSTGPVSGAGKSAIRSNALKHGFYSHTAVLKGFESNDDFEALHADYFDHLAPCGPVELELASRIVLSVWQLRRIQLAETQAFQFNLIYARNLVTKNFTNCEPWTLGYAFREDFKVDCPVLEPFARHRVRWDRTYYRALHELERLQLVRRGHAVPPPQILEIHAPDCALLAPSLAPPPPHPPASDPRVSEPRPSGSGTPAAPPPPQPPASDPRPSKPRVSDSCVSDPRPSGSATPPAATPSQPTPTHSPATPNPQIGFVSQKSANEPPPARPASPRKR